ncbi:MAG: SHOCT domain-containing protein [Bacillaceae bacterium]|nr:SHOCT domain-containing protein [Bacillaceae bacterium]
MMMNWGMMNLGMIFYMLFWIVILGFLIYGLLLLFMKLFNKDTTGSTSLNKDNDLPLHILKERFAKGELSEEEFEQKYALLKEKK